MNKPIPRGLLYALFALSGFAGLIYESIWSHYLKLMLGHAAYAQTLVLVIFMGGMAIGAWLTGRWSQGVARPLLWYAVVEGLLALSAFFFDPLFRAVQGWLFDGLIAGLETGPVIDVAKWGIAAMMTLPQAILLGATFPLMSAGLLRAHPQAPGSSLSWLYFTNSLGASAGVLASGFYLVDKVGLPGTIFTAGLINALLGCTVYLAERSVNPAPPLAARREAVASGFRVGLPVMLLTAALTGAASFLYEIGWIRMLSMVLGSATHSFELMLSAFILGLALGSLYIRKRIDTTADPLRLLGRIQIAMALLALLSLPLYMQTFDAMSAVLKTLAKNDYGYIGFTLFSHLVCLALMLPVTFCAGMTLPLITAVLLRAGHGEGSIGRVYAANTLGSITGVLLAVHLVMPVFGLRWVVVSGAMVDLALGVALLLLAPSAMSRVRYVAVAAAVLLALGLTTRTELDPLRTSSGVFRGGAGRVQAEIMFHRDGKTATIDLKRTPFGTIVISTNGKPDAAIKPGSTSLDDYMMVLAAVTPMAMLPEARQVGVIGMGSGRTTHSFLSNTALDRVDTVEIEPAMVEGAKLIGDSVERTFTDPRSHIIIEDAKTYFARRRVQYDIIMSEPSNPWVSGVATLFSTEFYSQVKKYLKPNGLFVQWVQLYEIDVPLISSILNALQGQFQDYRMYYTSGGDMLIIASHDRAVPEPGDWVFRDPGLAPMLDALNVKAKADFDQRLLGTARTLRPYFASFGYPPNSDYYPVLDQRAARLRFLQRPASDLANIIPYSTRLEDLPTAGTPTKEVLGLDDSEALVQARLIDRYYADRKIGIPDGISDGVIRLMDDLQPRPGRCDSLGFQRSWFAAMRNLTNAYGHFLASQTARAVASDVEGSTCAAYLDEEMRDWLGLLQAQTARDWSASLELSRRLMRSSGPQSPHAQTLLCEALLAAIRLQGAEGARAVLREFPDFPRDGQGARYLLANIDLGPIP